MRPLLYYSKSKEKLEVNFFFLFAESLAEYSKVWIPNTVGI